MRLGEIVSPVMNVLVLAAPIFTVVDAKTRISTGRALAVTVGLAWAGAALADELWHPQMPDAAFFVIMLPQIVVFISTIVATVMTQRFLVRRAILAALGGYALGVVLLLLIPPCWPAFAVAAPAIYPACAAVWACAR